MPGVVAVDQADVKRHARRVRERVEESGREVAAEPPGARFGQVDVARDERPVRDLEDDLRERLLGRHERGAVTRRSLRCGAGPRTTPRAPRRRPRPPASPSPGGSSSASSNPPLRASSPSRWSRTGIPVATFEFPPPGAIRALMPPRLAKSRGTNSSGHRPSSEWVRANLFRSGRSGCGWSIDVLLHRAWRASCSWARPWAHAIQGRSAAWPSGTAVVSYKSEQALAAALERHPAKVVRRVPPLRVVALRPAGSVQRFAQEIAAEPGIVRVERTSRRRSLEEPALVSFPNGLPYQWQFVAVRANEVPPAVVRAAAAVTIAVVDTGADLTAPDLSAKGPHTYSVRTRQADVPDTNGHGTFVAALAAGSSTNGDGIAGVGGDAGLMVVQAGGVGGAFTDVDEAGAIVYAVDHGARIINLSLGGSTTSSVERRAVDYAVSKGVLLVAAIGNGYLRGNAVEYPAALLQPIGSNGVGGRGLSVAASTPSGQPSAVLEHWLARLSRRARHGCLQRRLLRVVALQLPADGARGLARRPLRLQQRHVVRLSAGRRSGGARLGGEPSAARG